MSTKQIDDVADRRALYYPWVHFHSDDWVKRALIVFPGLVRMVAPTQLPNDSNLVYDLRGKSFIEHADLSTTNALDSQHLLIKLIQEDLDADAEGFRGRFGREAARPVYPRFQMHLDKTGAFLSDFLRSNGLAWTPDHPEQQGYSELHPSLGQAVMGTIAMACAVDAGLHVVGVDTPRGIDRSGELNAILGAGDRAGPYRWFVRREAPSLQDSSKMTRLFHTLVHLNCDVSHLDVDALVRLRSEREPLRVLKQNLRALGDEIPIMADPARQEEAFRDKANEIVQAWQRDRANLSKFAREVFAVEAIGGGASKFLETLQSKVLPVGVPGATVGTLLSAQAGLGILLVTHLGSSWSKVKGIERASPWRYLTLAQSQGATFSISADVTLR
jgi:hypothetical protein